MKPSLYLRSRRRQYLSYFVVVFCLLAFVGLLVGSFPVFLGATLSAVWCLAASEQSGHWLW